VHTVLHHLKQPVQQQITKHNLIPQTRNTNLQLPKIIITQTNSAQHTAHDNNLQTINNLTKTKLQIKNKIQNN